MKMFALDALNPREAAVYFEDHGLEAWSLLFILWENLQVTANPIHDHACRQAHAVLVNLRFVQYLTAPSTFDLWAAVRANA